MARPKSRGSDTTFSRDSPVVGTCAAPTLFMMRSGQTMTVNWQETDQIEARVRYLVMTTPPPEDSIVSCEACPYCAATLYLEGAPLPLPEPEPRHVRSRSRERIVIDLD